MQGLPRISMEGHRAIKNVRTRGETPKETEVIEMIEEAVLEIVQREEEIVEIIEIVLAVQAASTAMVAS